MVTLRTYTETEDRDSSIYLGIDESPIPFDYFKGVYLNNDMIFTDNPIEGVQFVVDSENFCVRLVTNDRNAYVTLEDIQADDLWYKINYIFNSLADDEGFRASFSDYATSIMQRDTLRKMYKVCRKNKLEIREKVYDNSGTYYMVKEETFFNLYYEDNLVREVERHLNFLQERMFLFDNLDTIHKLRCSKKTWKTLIKHFNRRIKSDTPKKFNKLNYYSDVTFIKRRGQVTKIKSSIFGCTLEFHEHKNNHLFIEL